MAFRLVHEALVGVYARVSMYDIPSMATISFGLFCLYVLRSSFQRNALERPIKNKGGGRNACFHLTLNEIYVHFLVLAVSKYAEKNHLTSTSFNENL